MAYAACGGIRRSSFSHRSVPFPAFPLASRSDLDHTRRSTGFGDLVPTLASGNAASSISTTQRKALPNTKFMTTIHHGIPAAHRPLFGKGECSCLPRTDFAGKASGWRGIRIARAAGMPLRSQPRSIRWMKSTSAVKYPAYRRPGRRIRRGRSTSERKLNC